MIAFVSFILCHACFGFILYTLDIFELMPQFNCIIDGKPTEFCTNDQICKGQSTPQINYTIDYSNSTSLHNWVEPLDLICVKGGLLGLIGSSFFIGLCVSTLVVPPLADKIGR